MDDVVAACSGTYRPQPPAPGQLTPRQRRTGRYLVAGWLLLVLALAVSRYREGGWVEVLSMLVLLLAVAAGGALVTRLAVRRGPATRVDETGLTARTGIRESRSVPWTDVVGFLPPGGFREHWSAQLHDGAVQALPGLPEAVAEQLAAAVATARGAGARAESDDRRRERPPRTPLPDVDGWDGPFHRSPPRR